MNVLTALASALGCCVIGILILPLLAYYFGFFEKPNHDRQWVEENNTRSKVYSRRELSVLGMGHAVLLGNDAQTGQPFPLSETVRRRHVALVGRSGAGKSTLFKTSFYLADIAHPAHIPVVIFDGQKSITADVVALCEQFQRTYYVFSESGWNPLAGSGDIRERAAIFADIYVQSQGTTLDGASKYYVDRAQVFLRAVIPLFSAAFPDLKFMTVRELIAACQYEEYRNDMLTRATTSREAADYNFAMGGWTLKDYKESLSGLINYLDKLLVGRHADWFTQRSAKTLEEAIAEDAVIIIQEGGSGQSIERTRGLLYQSALQQAILNRNAEDARKIVPIYYDEAPLYFSHTFPDFIARCRGKGAILHLGFQNFDQFAPYTDTILGNIATIIGFPGLKADDTVFLSEQIGKRLQQVATYSHRPMEALTSQQVSTSTTYEFLVQPHQIRHLREGEIIVLTDEGRAVGPYRVLRTLPDMHLPQDRYQPAENVNYFAAPTIWEHLAAKGVELEESLREEVNEAIHATEQDSWEE